MAWNLAHSSGVIAAYRFVSQLGHRTPFPASAKASLAARRRAPERWGAWARDARGPGPLVWAHAASVGEQQVVEPVLARLARTRPDLRLVLSHTSPSVCHTHRPHTVCQRDFLPWDEPGAMAATFDALRPALLLLGRGDLWPEMARAAAARGIPIAVAGGTVRPRSARLLAVARPVLRTVYGHVSWLGAVTPDDALRWTRLGVDPTRVVVTGDPRHDRVLEREADLEPARAIRRWAGEAPVLLAGSIEPTDDEVLASALAGTPLGSAPMRAVLVPHDATDARVEAIRAALDRRGCRAAVWGGRASAHDLPDTPVVIAAVRGVLADCYLGADLAYVGGGFRRGRLHAVAEPAAVGLPVIVGPGWEGGADAGAMVAVGGAVPVAADRAPGLAEVMRRLATDPAERARRGLAARSVLTDGAAHITAEAVLDRLPTNGTRLTANG